MYEIRIIYLRRFKLRTVLHLEQYCISIPPKNSRNGTLTYVGLTTVISKFQLETKRALSKQQQQEMAAQESKSCLILFLFILFLINVSLNVCLMAYRERETSQVA